MKKWIKFEAAEFELVDIDSILQNQDIIGEEPYRWMLGPQFEEMKKGLNLERNGLKNDLKCTRIPEINRRIRNEKKELMVRKWREIIEEECHGYDYEYE
jgi:hypothetical protein